MSTSFSTESSGCPCSRDTCQGCVTYEANKPPITNYDRIRAMTDEELANWIERIRVLCGNNACGQACPLKEVCYSMAAEPTETLDWLKQEAGNEML